jgi:uncharacterized protein YggE
MRKIIVSLISLLCICGALYAELTVTGKSLVEAKPDVVYLSFIIEKDGINAGEAQEFHKKIVNNVLEVLQKNEIAPERIKSDNYSLYPLYPEDKKEKVIYRSSIRVIVEVYQVSDLGPLIDHVLAVGNVRIEKIAFDLKTEEVARKEALKAALKDAKDKAGLIADELNLRLGQAVSADENLDIVYEGKQNETGILQNKNNTDVILRNKIFIKAETKVVFDTSPKE